MTTIEDYTPDDSWLDAELPLALVSTAPDTASRMTPGGTFVLDSPTEVPAVWGSGDDVLWSEGESLMICGPAGVGKTTLVGQLVAARIGLGPDVLGWPVKEGRRSLYLASDRPRQIQRAFRRLFNEEHRAALDDRLVVWPGPPPADLGAHPEILLTLAHQAGADTVFLDSLKDMALGLSDDETGSGLNRCLQRALCEGIEVVALHHQRKGSNGEKPKDLASVYGSTWITAGAGSVVLLWGQPGDALVELIHLKQPAGTVGPLTIEHDHTTGRSAINRGFDPLAFLRLHPKGATAIDAARAMHETQTPNDNEQKATRRKLDRLVKDGHAYKHAAEAGGSGGTTPARYYLTDHQHEATT